jgi:hypothetical protein
MEGTDVRKDSDKEHNTKKRTEKKKEEIRIGRTKKNRMEEKQEKAENNNRYENTHPIGGLWTPGPVWTRWQRGKEPAPAGNRTPVFQPVA